MFGSNFHGFGARRNMLIFLHSTTLGFACLTIHLMMLGFTCLAVHLGPAQGLSLAVTVVSININYLTFCRRPLFSTFTFAAFSFAAFSFSAFSLSGNVALGVTLQSDLEGILNLTIAAVQKL